MLGTGRRVDMGKAFELCNIVTESTIMYCTLNKFVKRVDLR